MGDKNGSIDFMQLRGYIGAVPLSDHTGGIGGDPAVWVYGDPGVVPLLLPNQALGRETAEKVGAVGANRDPNESGRGIPYRGGNDGQYVQKGKNIQGTGSESDPTVQ